MMLTPHMLAGAAIGGGVRKAWLALPLAFGSHFLLDRLPHVDPDALPGVHRTGPAAAVAVVETLFGVALVAWAVRGTRWRWVAAGAAFCGALIDLLDNIPPWGDAFSAWPGTAWLSAFHTRMQGDVSPDRWAFGVAVQVVVAGLCLWYLVYLRRRESRRKGAPGNRGAGSRPQEVGR